MRKNHDKRHADSEERYDRVYVDWPHLWGVSRLIARPLKTIYINRSAAPWGSDKIFADVPELESYCNRWDIELP